MTSTPTTWLRGLGRMLLAVGPGIFCIGYTIGTGSVTTMTSSGSRFGMSLLWDLVLSCLFAWVLMEAYGRFALVTGETAMHAFRKRLPGGPLLAGLTLVGVVMGQWCCLSGLVGLSSAALYEGLRLFVPSLPAESYYGVLLIAAAVLAVMYSLLWVGRYSFFEKVLVVFVTLMGISFLVSAVVVLPSPREIAAGLVPSIPRDAEGHGMFLLVAALVGTTMAAPTFVVRPLLLTGKGWTRANLRDQARDSFVAALLMFLISASIMACATAALYHRGMAIEKVLDMVHTLGPVAGKYAVAIFLVGTVSAGLSSIFPIAMVAPLLVADYRAGVLDVRSKLFRTLTAVACLLGMTVPILGSNPIAAQIATQVAQVFVLPLVVGGILVLVNRRELMGPHKAGPLLNLGLAGALAFSLVISYIAAHGLVEKLT